MSQSLKEILNLFDQNKLKKAKIFQIKSIGSFFSPSFSFYYCCLTCDRAFF